GSVHSMQAGQCVSYDKDLGAGWWQLTAVRQGGELRLYVNGQLVAKSATFNTADYDLSVKQPLKIGFGEHDYFTGRIREVRLYRRALADREIAALLKSSNLAETP
ncbi:MAG: LamG-like jellyroll fold domain-containing protein, partial [Limisphaerales bacterium]